MFVKPSYGKPQKLRKARDKVMWARKTPGNHYKDSMHAGMYLRFSMGVSEGAITYFWGDYSTTCSLSYMRELVRLVQVDSGMKAFNIGDEFLVHSFKAHLLASICSLLKVNSSSKIIQHENSLDWFRLTAEQLIADTLMRIFIH